MPLTPFPTPSYTPSTTPPSGFTAAGLTPSTTPPAGFTAASLTPSTTPPGAFAAAGLTPSTTPPTGFTAGSLTPSTTAPTPFFAVGSNLLSLVGLKAIPTLLVTPAAEVVQVVQTAELWELYQLTAGTHAEADGFVLPDDYHATTNAKFWTRIASGTYSPANPVDPIVAAAQAIAGGVVPGTSGEQLAALTALTGGGAAALDGVVTVGVTPPVVRAVVVGGVLQFWRLRAGTTAENAAGGIVRPDDYNASTNAKVWEQAL